MNTTRLLTFIIFFLIYSSCSSYNSEKRDKSEKVNYESVADSQLETDPSKKQILSVTDTLFKGDTLKIKFKTPHFKDLAITTPDDKLFFVVYGFNDSKKPSLVDWVKFANVDNLEIITNKTKVNPWDKRIKENQIIFTKTGNYEIRLSENLETDDGTPVEIETVYYIDKSRKE